MEVGKRESLWLPAKALKWWMTMNHVQVNNCEYAYLFKFRARSLFDSYFPRKTNSLCQVRDQKKKKKPLFGQNYWRLDSIKF